MPPFRNPFGKKPPVSNGVNPTNDENQRPYPASDHASQTSSLAGSRASSSLSIKPKEEEAGEYKLSVYDSGVYLPPSPPEKKSFWAKSPVFNGTGTNNHRSILNENEPFSISRESFESYRRSFDISARSPVPQQHDTFTPRQSTDTRQSTDSNKPPAVAALGFKSPRIPTAPLSKDAQQQLPSHDDNPEPMQTDDANDQQDPQPSFEDVHLADEDPSTTASKKEIPAPTKKRGGIFARFGDNPQQSQQSQADNSQQQGASVVGGSSDRPGSSSHRGFHLPGRKRGQSASQGAELGPIQQANGGGGVRSVDVDMTDAGAKNTGDDGIIR